MASSASFHPFLLPYSPHLQPEHLQNLPKPLIVAIHGLLKFMQCVCLVGLSAALIAWQ
ncbi:hypothetical protein BT69DRAFT_790498 [Atractiella rhizophila]|nr:hypothetical protein BT69DRAFT_790498 [Atractiella rhizophila]